MSAGSIARMRTFRATSGFPFRLLLRLLLTGGNVSSCYTVTYAPKVRRVFGYLKLAFLVRKCNPFRGTSFASGNRRKDTRRGSTMVEGSEFLRSQVNSALV